MNTTDAIKVCRLCKKEYALNRNYSFAQKQRSKFCSRSCQYKGRDRSSKPIWNKGLYNRSSRKCQECRTTNIRVTFYQAMQKLLCPRHWRQYKIYGAVQWVDVRPLKTPESRRLKHTLLGKNWRLSVFTRDDFRCFDCGERGKQLNAHHIFPFSLFPRIRFDINNGQTLCVACHKKTPTYGRKVDRYEFQKST